MNKLPNIDNKLPNIDYEVYVDDCPTYDRFAIDEEFYNNHHLTPKFGPLCIYTYENVDYWIISLSYREYPNQLDELCKEAIEFEEEFEETIRIVFVNLKDFDELVTSGYLKKIIEIWGKVIHKADVVFAPVKCVNKCVTSRKCVININDTPYGFPYGNGNITEIEVPYLDEHSHDYKHSYNYEDEDEYLYSDENLHEEEKLRKKFNKRFGLIEFLKEHIIIPFLFMIVGIMFQIQVHHKKFVHIMIISLLVLMVLVLSLIW